MPGKVWLFGFILLLLNFPISAQTSYYGTHTLQESFHNPSSTVFDQKKECKKLVFSFLVPDIQADLSSFGPLSRSWYLVSLINKLDSGLLVSSPNPVNYLSTHDEIHLSSLKFLWHSYNSSEVLLDYSIHGEGFINLSNQALNLVPVLNNMFQNTGQLSGSRNYPNILNSKSYAYVYSEFGIGYRENRGEDFSWGFHAAYLDGILANKFTINQSNLSLGNPNALLQLQGSFLIKKPFTSDSSYQGLSSIRTYLPNFTNPGIKFSAGFTYKTDTNARISLNFQDLGIIHWKSGKSFGSVDSILYTLDHPFNLRKEAKSQYKSFYKDLGYSSFNTLLPLKVEGFYEQGISPHWRAGLGFNKYVFTPEGNIELINDYQLDHFHFILNTGYNLLGNFKMGLNLIYRNSWIETYIGSNNLFPSLNFPGQLRGTQFQGNSSAISVNFGLAFRIGNCFKIQNQTDMRLKGPYPFFQRIFQRKPTKYEESRP